MASERGQRRLERLLDQIDDAETQGNWELVRSLALDALEFDAENVEVSAYLRVAERHLSEGAIPAQETASTPGTTNSGNVLPTSFANGRYQVKRFLGEGGKKRVYLANDTLLDRDVAFALIKTEGLDDVSRTRITREAQAMGRLGSHPHIVTVFDLGDQEGQPFMVTELMGGGDVEGVIEDAADHKLSLEQAINITRETCRGLEFAHSRGIVHRDLKPGNVWLTSDGVAKIGDFGLAVAIDRSRLTTEGMMVGTVSYMPPEQAMGGEVTPKSDLYSLGAMLYEMVTGRPPFLGDDSVSIIGQHINTPPVAPSWHNGQCPRPLEALILRLLAKDPQERPASATDVLAALDGLDLTAVAEASVEESQPLDSLAGGVFVGRQREMGELKACLEDALSGRGRLVTLVGEPGIGKTRTAQELATYAGLRSAQVLWGRCYEEQGMPPYWPWVQAIRSYVRERDPEQLRSEMGAGAADIAEVVSDVKERLPDLKPPPQLDSPEQARFRLFDSITTFLKSASQKQPLVLVLDDLHWADTPSLLLLQFVARELGGARLLLVGTYRDMELSRQHPLAETLGELTRERLFQRVLLRGLSQEDVGRFIEVAAGFTPPPGLTQAVYTQTEGNPLFVTEVVRLLVQEGALSADPSTSSGRAGETDSWAIRIPEGVREVIGRRLNRLSQRCNETLTIASVIGREFTLAQLKPLIEDMSEDRLLEVLEEALSARVIEELPQSVGRYQFSHALIKETLIEELTLTRRVRLHARIAETLEELYGANVEAHAAELAHHFAAAEAVLGAEKLVHYSQEAGKKALDAYAFEEAEAHFRRALASKGETQLDLEAAELRFGLGSALAATAERHLYQEAADCLISCFEYFSESGHTARAAAVAAHPVPNPLSRLIWRAKLVDRALEMVPPDSSAAGRLLIKIVHERGRLQGDYAAAQEAFDRCLSIARNTGDLSVELGTLVTAGEVDLFHMRYHQVMDRIPKIGDLARTLNEPAPLAWAYYIAAWGAGGAGDVEKMSEYAFAALEASKILRYRNRLGAGYLICQLALELKGDWARAQEFSDRGLEFLPRDPRNLAARALLEAEVGSLQNSMAFLNRAVEALRVTPVGPTITHSQTAILMALVARICNSNSQQDVVKEAAEAVLSDTGVNPLPAYIARSALSVLAILDKDADAASSMYSIVSSIEGALVPMGSICHHRLLGLLSHTMGTFDQASEHFEEALAFCRKTGCRPELAWTCCDYADTQLQRNNAADREKAMSLLDESLAISSELGMRPLMERVLSRREILKA